MQKEENEFLRDSRPQHVLFLIGLSISGLLLAFCTCYSLSSLTQTCEEDRISRTNPGVQWDYILWHNLIIIAWSVDTSVLIPATDH